MTNHTAWATWNDSITGADAGIGVQQHDTDTDGYREEKGVVAESDPQDWPEWDADAADELLATMGYRRTGSWTDSGDQMAAEVEPTDA
jgi:hypothetical protein